MCSWTVNFRSISFLSAWQTTIFYFYNYLKRIKKECSDNCHSQFCQTKHDQVQTSPRALLLSSTFAHLLSYWLASTSRLLHTDSINYFWPPALTFCFNLTYFSPSMNLLSLVNLPAQLHNINHLSLKVIWIMKEAGKYLKNHLSNTPRSTFYL